MSKNDKCCNKWKMRAKYKNKNKNNCWDIIYKSFCKDCHYKICDLETFIQKQYMNRKEINE